VEEIIMLNISNLIVTSQPIKNALKSDIDKLCESIKELGLLYPLMVRPIDKGKYEVLDGRTRLSILRDLNYKNVKCIVRHGEEVKDEVVPYDVELCRRHLTVKEIQNFEDIRKRKKEEAESSSVSHLIYRLPVKCRRRAKKFIDDIPIGSRRRCLEFLLTMAEPDLQDYFELSSLKFECEKLRSSKERLEKKLDNLDKKKEAEITKRCEAFAEEVQERMAKIEAVGVKIPMNDEEKTVLMKQIEGAVRMEMDEEIKVAQESLDKNKKLYADLVKDVGKKDEEIKTLVERNKDLNVHIGMVDDIREHFNIMLHKSVSIKPIITKVRTIYNDLDAFAGRLHEWRSRPNVSGRGKFDDMTEENIFLLQQEITAIQKKGSEIMAQLKSG